MAADIPRFVSDSTISRESRQVLQTLLPCTSTLTMVIAAVGITAVAGGTKAVDCVSVIVDWFMNLISLEFRFVVLIFI